MARLQSSQISMRNLISLFKNCQNSASVQKQDEPSTLVQDPTEDVNIGSEDDPMILKIGTSLCPEEEERLTKFLKQHGEVFAWTYEDMPGLDPKISRTPPRLKARC